MRLFKLIGAVCLGAFLAGCGGGGGSAGTSQFGTGSGSTTGGTGTGTTTAAGASVVVSISSTTVSAAAPGTVKAVVLNSSGAAQAGQVVSFSTQGGLGAFNVATALTDSTGTATVTLTPASATANGADLVVASVTLSGTVVTGTIGFQVKATAATPVGSPALALTLSSTSVTAANPATVTATVTDSAGNPLSGQVVQFSSVGPLGTFSPSSALTGASGAATVSLSPATSTTNGAALAVAQATVSGTTLTASSGFSVVSSGAPSAGTPSIALTLSSSVVTTSAPATAVALVLDGTGAPVAGQVVKFSTVDGLGTFSVSSALTDATGKASVVLSAVSGKSGADQVLAATTVNGTSLQASQGFQLTVSSATIASFTSDIATLGPYGQANLTVKVTGASAATPVSLSLTSACVALGKATLTPSTATTTTGTATFTYRDVGCGANDASDPLQVSIVGTTVTQTLSLGLTSPTVSSIVFKSATPAVIYLKGSGLTQTSSLIFQVVDTAGNGLPNQSVTLQLLAAPGGLTLDGGTVPVTKTSDSLGDVSVLINSGTVPTPVTVQATLAGGISTVSNGLSVAVGLPSELNFSLSQGTRNIEGYDVDGTPNTYNIIAADRLGNPVPTGTSVNFISEAGTVEPIKQTALSAGLARATANFLSAGSRPVDGRVTVLAYALGEESFLDTNGNNIFDPGIDTQFQDLGSVFLSRKFLNTYFPATDQLIPLSIPGVANNVACAAITTPLLALDASIPTVGGSTCDGVWGSAYVRRAVQTVLSTSSARPIWQSAPATLYSNTSASCPTVQDNTTQPGTPMNPIVGYLEGSGTAVRQAFYTVGGNTTVYVSGGTGLLSMLMADANPVRINPVAAGTTITATGTTGLTIAVNGGSPVPSVSEPSSATISYTFSVGTTSGTITINITSPSGLVTTVVQPIVLGNTPASGSTLCP
jgi:hypothetical protein